MILDGLLDRGRGSDELVVEETALAEGGDPDHGADRDCAEAVEEEDPVKTGEEGRDMVRLYDGDERDEERRDVGDAEAETG